MSADDGAGSGAHRLTAEDAQNAWELISAVLGQDRDAFATALNAGQYEEWQSRRADAIALFSVTSQRLFRRAKLPRPRLEAPKRAAILHALQASEWGDLVDTAIAAHCLAIAANDESKLAPPTVRHLTTSAVVCAQLLHLEIRRPQMQQGFFSVVTRSQIRRGLASRNSYRFS